MTAAQATHAAIVDLGFEGSVLKRRRSVYRGGRSRGWVKYKARYWMDATVVGVRQTAKAIGMLCDVDGRTVPAVAGPGDAEQIGEVVRLVYSRVDADGGLREARLQVRRAPPNR